eukprot:Cvel_27569.t1-p1 / transcript=Cvel_27569.t1 / gene=Cvel_27569 / organism=Chromera_velia_CCMP2878 / gene_product=hypothetical protein / transcript_product=hypothetical protein / location=Cvel_scaffold3464:4291-9072(-) / protein_length=991 / sequence_SO=supercontig / SO=protein_coding / is_pseudo=false
MATLLPAVVFFCFMDAIQGARLPPTLDILPQVLRLVYLFDEFYEDAVYHPVWGYYSKGRGGVTKDFQTLPTLFSPGFGQAFAERAVTALYDIQELHPSENLFLFEFGGGTGALSHDILNYLHTHHPLLAQRTRYVGFEVFEGLQEAQKELNKQFVDTGAFTILKGDVRNSTDVTTQMASLLSKPTPESYTGVPGVFVSNELPDTFPYAKVRVSLDDARLPPDRPPTSLPSPLSLEIGIVMPVVELRVLQDLGARVGVKALSEESLLRFEKLSQAFMGGHKIVGGEKNKEGGKLFLRSTDTALSRDAYRSIRAGLVRCRKAKGQGESQDTKPKCTEEDELLFLRSTRYLEAFVHAASLFEVEAEKQTGGDETATGGDGSKQSEPKGRDEKRMATLQSLYRSFLEGLFFVPLQGISVVPSVSLWKHEDGETESGSLRIPLLVNLGMEALTETWAALFGSFNGAVLTADYGFDGHLALALQPGGATLRAFSQREGCREAFHPGLDGERSRELSSEHTLAGADAVFRCPGLADVTADVDFLHLAAVGMRRGFVPFFFGHVNSLETPVPFPAQKGQGEREGGGPISPQSVYAQGGEGAANSQGVPVLAERWPWLLQGRGEGGGDSGSFSDSPFRQAVGLRDVLAVWGTNLFVLAQWYLPDPISSSSSTESPCEGEGSDAVCKSKEGNGEGSWRGGGSPGSAVGLRSLSWLPPSWPLVHCEGVKKEAQGGGGADWFKSADILVRWRDHVSRRETASSFLDRSFGFGSESGEVGFEMKRAEEEGRDAGEAVVEVVCMDPFLSVAATPRRLSMDEKESEGSEGASVGKKKDKVRKRSKPFGFFFDSLTGNLPSNPTHSLSDLKRVEGETGFAADLVGPWTLGLFRVLGEWGLCRVVGELWLLWRETTLRGVVAAEETSNECEIAREEWKVVSRPNGPTSQSFVFVRFVDHFFGMQESKEGMEVESAQVHRAAGRVHLYLEALDKFRRRSLIDQVGEEGP